MVRSALAVRHFPVLRRGPVRMVRGPQTCPEPLREPRGPLISDFLPNYLLFLQTIWRPSRKRRKVRTVGPLKSACGVWGLRIIFQWNQQWEFFSMKSAMQIFFQWNQHHWIQHWKLFSNFWQWNQHWKFFQTCPKKLICKRPTGRSKTFGVWGLAWT